MRPAFGYYVVGLWLGAGISEGLCKHQAVGYTLYGILAIVAGVALAFSKSEKRS